MARKTLGKMEFESLVKSLQEQNKGQIAAQQETTKSIKNLQAYFIKQDRADMRRRLEQGLDIVYASAKRFVGQLHDYETKLDLVNMMYRNIGP